MRGHRAHAEDDRAGENERNGHQQESSARIAGLRRQLSHRPCAGKTSQCSTAIDERGDFAGYILGEYLRNNREERAVGSVHGAAGNN